MKLIIDIPEKTYEKLKFLEDMGFGTTSDVLILSGTPLSNIINTLDEMDLADYDYHTIQAIKQILNGDEVTH